MVKMVQSDPQDFQFSEVEIFNFTMHKTERSDSCSNNLHPLNQVDPTVVLNFGMHNTSKGSTTFPTSDYRFNQSSVKIFRHVVDQNTCLCVQPILIIPFVAESYCCQVLGS